MNLTTEQKIKLAKLAGFVYTEDRVIDLYKPYLLYKDTLHKAMAFDLWLSSPQNWGNEFNWNDIQLIEDGIIKIGAHIEYSNAGDFHFYTIYYKDDFESCGIAQETKANAILAAALEFCKYLNITAE